MPLIGLLNVLENMLQSLLMKNQISSWQLKSGFNSTQVILRFVMADSANENLRDSCYKRKTKSHIVRAKSRLATWKELQNRTNANWYQHAEYSDHESVLDDSPVNQLPI